MTQEEKDFSQESILAEQLHSATESCQMLGNADIALHVREVAKKYQLNTEQTQIFLAECLIIRGFRHAPARIVASLEDPLNAFPDDGIILQAQVAARPRIRWSVRAC